MMSTRQVFLGQQKLNFSPDRASGELLFIDGEAYYKISNYDQMPPFFMTLTSDSDIWTFIYSNGGLSAGRKSSDLSIFPYYTDDQLSQLSESTGSKTIMLVAQEGHWHLWLPFSDQYKGGYQLERNLYKNSLGNKLIFEEKNVALSLTYRLSWMNSRKFGLVKKSELINSHSSKQNIRILDGLQNILPPGILQQVQQTKSNLANAYKKCELLKESNIGIYSLSSNIIDRPEPSESLRATAVWSCGVKPFTNLLSTRQLQDFIRGYDIIEESSIRAEQGAYLVVSEFEITGNEGHSWYFCADINLSAGAISDLDKLINEHSDVSELIEEDIAQGSKRLSALVFSADGSQVTSDTVGNSRHLANSLFNVMRGGIYADEYNVEKVDFLEFVQKKNKEVFERFSSSLESIPNEVSIEELKGSMAQIGDIDLVRYANEYLPITFSRRHGDPSRPWNRFNIDLFQEDGNWRKRFEGNWRDIFQNWEALCYSYPEFTENIIALFLNASTIDGYNPYRITSNGIEWEVTDPDDPWSFIGYWGDHQIIYLLKLLETSLKFHPDYLKQFVNKSFFTFANVPYRIKSYGEICNDPYNTITYDVVEEKTIGIRESSLGVDGRMYMHDEKIVYASLTEKLLITLLTKLSNFVPEGGIWMNTQRPEWNDANNALVGHGLSMVTVYYLHRYVNFISELYKTLGVDQFEVYEELDEFFNSIFKVFSDHAKGSESKLTNEERKEITDSLGRAGEQYRKKVYHKISGKRCQLSRTQIIEFLDISLQFLTGSIRANKRKDGLFHSYNLIALNENDFGVEHLYPMLEGQVAVLSSGVLDPEESLDVLDALRASVMYREDQNSYTLYPDRPLSTFIEKARIDSQSVQRSELLLKLLEVGDDSIIYKDSKGNYHFDQALSNEKDLDNTLLKLGEEEDFQLLVEKESAYIKALFEDVFHHHSFTGRSGTFFAYEGLGSIYWHMNSKLLLATQENYFKAKEQGSAQVVLDGLKKHYYDIKEGLGTHKSPEEYGAFPTDPYSHTPSGKGAQQPGMTGQVKEDLLSRIGELGIAIKSGAIAFKPELLRMDEYLTKKDELKVYSNGKEMRLQLKAGELGFTFCGIPVIYTLSDHSSIEVLSNDGQSIKTEGSVLNQSSSTQVFQRSKDIVHIRVNLNF